MGRCCFEDYKPAMAMAGLQCLYSGVTLLAKAALGQGMSPRVFVVYRQGIAALVLAPAAYFSHGKEVVLGRKIFWLVFIAAFVGTTVNNNLYILGLHLGSSSMAAALSNLTPAITFLMAAPLGNYVGVTDQLPPAVSRTRSSFFSDTLASVMFMELIYFEGIVLQ